MGRNRTIHPYKRFEPATSGLLKSLGLTPFPEPLSEQSFSDKYYVLNLKPYTQQDKKERFRLLTQLFWKSLIKALFKKQRLFQFAFQGGLYSYIVKKFNLRISI